MIRYALVIFYPAPTIGLYSKTWKDGLTLDQAEKARKGFLSEYSGDPQNVQIIQYRTDE